MKVAQLFQSALVALLVLMFAGCTAVHKMTGLAPATKPRFVQNQSVPPGPVSPAPAVGSTPEVAISQPTLGEFPSSKVRPAKPDWDVMHTDGFTGGYDVACNLLGLTASQCATYKRMHEEGKCTTMEVPNGVVLDRLTFTRNRGHFVQNNVKVDLKNPPTRMTEVCLISTGRRRGNKPEYMAVMRFHGCNNQAIVHGVTLPDPSPVPPVASAQCSPLAKSVMVNIWEEKALDVRVADGKIFRQLIVATTSAPSDGWYAPDRVSRSGAPLRAAHARGELQLDSKAHGTVISRVKADGSVNVLYQGNITGQYQFALPADFADREYIRIVFNNLGGFHSPVSEFRAAYSEHLSSSGCGLSVMNYNMIAR